MLAGAPIITRSTRQHLKGPDSHSVEVVAAGTNLTDVVTANGTLQELHIRQGKPTPFYLDSKTTMFVAVKDTGVKKSVWLTRRVDVLREGVDMGEINPIHISERDMLADPFTKYLPHAVWHRHMGYLVNREVWEKFVCSTTD